ncbi:hypothetical protein PVAG01_10953 [Phlyctema vagabunda]|uniref:Uncharacterized protein n=1 Tax=Phlyctema vagabunda TaxID=108571 RepID=A0ABR4P3Q2_9HELO
MFGDLAQGVPEVEHRGKYGKVAYYNSSGFVSWPAKSIKIIFVGDDTEARIAEILDRVRYTEMSASAVFKFLQAPQTRIEIITHLTYAFILPRVSLKGTYEMSFLPFPEDVFNVLPRYLELLRKLRLPPSFMSHLRKIPYTIASEFDDVDPISIVRDHAIESLCELLLPYADDKYLWHSQLEGPRISPGFYETFLISSIYMFFKLLESPEQLEVRWPESSETCFATHPDIYALAGEDGVQLDEPKLLRRGNRVTVLDDGSLLGTFNQLRKCCKNWKVTTVTPEVIATPKVIATPEPIVTPEP